MRNKAIAAVNDRTLTRRSLVEWIGGATVLALGGELLAACSGSDKTAEAQPQPQPEPCGRDADWPFEPDSGKASVYEWWFERTVDRQDLTRLLSSWHLRVDGMVATATTLSFADLLQLPRRDQVTDFHCVEGWSVYDVPWNGVHLSSLLERVGPEPSATYLTAYSFDGIYTESLPLDVALEPRTLLAYGVNCNTLPLIHGFPLRLVVPRKFGYKNAKYINRIELTDQPVDGYWVQRGYSYEADVPATRLRPGKY